MWMITYTSKSNSKHFYFAKEVEYHTTVTDILPVEWLIRERRRFPGSDLFIIFAMEISKNQAKRLREQL